MVLFEELNDVQEHRRSGLVRHEQVRPLVLFALDSGLAVPALRADVKPVFTDVGHDGSLAPGRRDELNGHSAIS